MNKVNIDWNNLGFAYMETPYRYRQVYTDGKWQAGEMTSDPYVTIKECSTALHYGQEAFEGLKAYRCKDGTINLFRIEENAKRFRRSCERILMPPVEESHFIEVVKQVVLANEDYIPPYGSGGSLYIRPFMIGIGNNIGVSPAPEYLFSVFVMPVGAYFKGGLKPTCFLVTDIDRAAPNGTGDAKVGGNYAGSFIAIKAAKAKGYGDAVYLDPKSHTKIEEIGSANFFAISKDNSTLVTPLSHSILPSITKYSLLYLAENRLNMKVEERDIYIDQLDKFSEAGACGTAAVISPIGGIEYHDKLHVFYSLEEVGPITTKLYNELVGIQLGDIPAPEGWITKVK